MAGKVLISLSDSNSTFHLEGEIEPTNLTIPMLEYGEPWILEPLAILPPAKRDEGLGGGQDGWFAEPGSGPPFNRALTLAKEDTKWSGPGDDASMPSRRIGGCPTATVFTESKDKNNHWNSRDTSSY
uniref:Uncharacterized protein n=1 Tax=Oryza punctata TaxID=4537 RepID=A0A0E0M647_ORYPU